MFYYSVTGMRYVTHEEGERRATSWLPRVRNNIPEGERGGGGSTHLKSELVCCLHLELEGEVLVNVTEHPSGGKDQPRMLRVGYR